MFEPDREPDHVRRYAGRALLFFRELGMRGRSRMQGQTLGIPDVRQMGKQLQGFDETLAVFPPAFNAENHHAADAQSRGVHCAG